MSSTFIEINGFYFRYGDIQGFWQEQDGKDLLLHIIIYGHDFTIGNISKEKVLEFAKTIKKDYGIFYI